MYLNTTAVDSHHPISRVFLSHRPPTKATCVTFWFSGSGSISRLNVYRFTKETAFRDPPCFSNYASKTRTMDCTEGCSSLQEIGGT
ncbi:hypothetical protein MRX96_035640 [Rhipicephalus microplus]